MIVCNSCGRAVSQLGIICPSCSGRGIEQPTLLRGFLTPSQQRGSPDRWAKSYNTPQSTLRDPPPLRCAGEIFDVPLDRKAGSLARVYGSVLEPHVKHPQCVTCSTQITPGAKLYLATDAEACKKHDVLCRSCFSHRFNLGSCDLCKTAVLGEREEGGPHVRGRAGIVWHAKCFVCYKCSKSLREADNILMPSGDPSCLSCANLAEEESMAEPACSDPLPPCVPPSSRQMLPARNANPLAPRHHNPQIAIQAKRRALADLVSIANHSTPNRQAFGSRACPGCFRSVLLHEIGTLKGPQDTQWHRSCLRCGSGTQSGAQGCGKPLDASATLRNNVVWCRSCSFEIPSTSDGARRRLA